ncbi:dihydropteroate synthase [Paraglaciecola aquimarina]|uniref:Dihydropteroate synthase n=1 Tax=Paraglaciecola algarum TaxID=3050085 RepID=A0ABS9D1J1_9ALTE|nr:dihydropteroate synthase [Paraglaciecola sp. G1-23]MCF2946790.1 dihydropteroate synthase [Paraglaciecola sp. G1-23]
MQFKNKFIDLTYPKIMGILNVTPDSFSDGGSFNKLDNALTHAELMIAQGADFIDVGGESTRPGAREVSTQQELDRVIPIIEAIQQRFDTVVSIDTSKAQVMQDAVKAGAGLINDVRALQLEGALTAAANAKVPVCLMHMQGQPKGMQNNPNYQDVMGEVNGFLQSRIEACNQAGIATEHIIVDPGFGFGKSLEHNYQLLAQLNELSSLGCAILSGTSRKSMLGNLLNRGVEQRLAGSIVTAGLAVQMGAKILRVHDVKETLDAIKITTLVEAYRKK